MEKTYNISLNISNKNGVFPLFRVVQGDNITRKIVASLYDENGDAYTPGTGVTAEYWSQKPDKTGTNHSATLSGSTVTIVLTEQDTAAVGDVYATVKLKKNNEVLSAIPFRFKVEAFPLGANIESTSDYQTMVEATAATEQATADAIEATTAAEAATEYATEAADTASNYNIDLLAEGYDATAIYVKGDYVIYQGALYRCMTDILTPEAWTASHGVAVELGADVAKAQRDATEGYSDTLTAGDLTSDEYQTDDEPYLFRRTFGGANNHEMDTLVGGTVAWNQLMQNGDFANGTSNWWGNRATISMESNQLKAVVNNASTAFFGLGKTVALNIENHVFVSIVDAETNNDNFQNFRISFGKNSSIVQEVNFRQIGGQHYALYKATQNMDAIYYRAFFSQTVTSGVDYVLFNSVQFFDLTQMFGSTIADAVYAMEQAESGSGVAWFRKYFPESYYAYDNGSLKSVEAVAHRMVGKNLLPVSSNKTTISGITYIVSNNGEIIANGTATADSVYDIAIPSTVPSGNYYFCGCADNGSNSTYNVFAWDYTVGQRARRWNGTTASTNSLDYATPVEVQVIEGHNIKIRLRIMSGYTANNVVFKPMLIFGDVLDTTFEPYKQHTYKLSPLTLRGIPKLTNGKLQYDGDTYEPSGQVVRRYGMVNLATATLARRSTETSGLYRCAVKMTSNYIKLNSLKIVCNCLKTVRAVETFSDGQRVEYSISSDANDGQYINFFATDLQTVEAWQAFFASHNAYVVYELATPTTETASPYEPTQVIYADGTEEYISQNIVPVGHVTKYPVSIKAKIYELIDTVAQLQALVLENISNS